MGLFFFEVFSRVSTVIETRKLSKIYEGARKGQDVHALKSLDLDVMKGEIFGYLGPNGSGKTTTIKMLLNLIFPTSGTIKIMGSDDITSPSVRKHIGYLPEGAYYPDFLKGEEILRFYGQLYGLGGKDLEKRIDSTIELVGMSKARKRLLRGYSKGMRQRIGLAQALLNDPQILILDEPTTGLDPVARKEIRDLLVHLRNQGKTLLISSHELLEVELISNRVGILYEGVLQTMGTITELLTERDLAIDVDRFSDEKLDRFVQRGIVAEDRIDDKAKLRVPTSMAVHEAVELCRAADVTVVGIAPRRETLEELFVRTVGAARQGKESK
ncbi:MAG: ABC transporter ATP-binding protein [Candidatus Hydrogenedentota bacterium]